MYVCCVRHAYFYTYTVQYLYNTQRPSPPPFEVATTVFIQYSTRIVPKLLSVRTATVHCTVPFAYSTHSGTADSSKSAVQYYDYIIRSKSERFKITVQHSVQ